MSLLLDALKKAADDKEKSSRDSSSGTSASTPDSFQDKRTTQDVDQDSAKDEVESFHQDDESRYEAKVKAAPVVDAGSDAEELTLDLEDEALENDASAEPPPEEDDSTLHSSAHHEYVQQDLNRSDTKQQLTDLSSEHDEMALEDKAETPHRISNDALSLLIDKTNHEVKRGKTVSIAILVIVTLVILVSGGAYFYTDMQAEIAAIERKHQIAMQSMRAKTNREETPQQSAIIKNLVSDAELEEKVEYAKAQMANDRKQAPEVKPRVASKNKAVTAELSIKRTNKVDPVAEKLDAAWIAYDDGRYDDAGKLYREVLEIEDNNRDALLGLGAIAVINKEQVQARQIYLSLLQLDPRDPIATAALAGLSSDTSSLQEDNKYLMSMLEKNPDAPHLNFSLANNFAQQNKWKSAQQYYFKAWQYDSENADYLFNLAVSMDQLDKTEQAIGFYRDSLIKAKDRQVSFSREAVQKRIDELTQL